MALTELQQIQIDKANIREQLGEIPTGIDFPKTFKDSIGVYELPLVISKRTRIASNTMQWDNPNRGWGYDYASATDVSLGTSEIITITNSENRYTEYFAISDYIDTTTSTASIDYSNLQCVMSSSILQSNLIAYTNGTNIGNAKITISSSSDFTCYLSNCVGSDSLPIFEQVTNNIKYTFTNSGQVLRYKVTGTGTITKIIVEYNK